MSTILYYSTKCSFCTALIARLRRENGGQDMHFVCIDKRVKEPNGTVSVVLKNNQKIRLPPTVKEVPSLLLLNRGHRVLSGKEVSEHLFGRTSQTVESRAEAPCEPAAFSFSNGANGVVSDGFSFLDQSADDLSSKGGGGTRQMYHYATFDQNDAIETPPDTYEPGKITESEMERKQKERDLDIPVVAPRR